MRIISLSILAIALVGCSPGAEPQSMGTSAPDFGSSPNLSTIEGFVVGTWKFAVDTSTARSGNGASAGLALDTLANRTLDIKADGTTPSTPVLTRRPEHGSRLATAST